MSRVRCAALFVICATFAHAQEVSPPSDRYPSKILVEQFAHSLGATSGYGARPLPITSLEILKHFEGWYPKAYNDPVGYCTIGFGHLIALKRCEQIDLGKWANSLSLSDGSALLETDTTQARVAVQELVKVELSDDQFGALSSFVFNVGKGNFANSTLLLLINEKRFDLAPGQFARWVKAKGNVLPGLVARRACERGHFLGNVNLAADGKFDRNQCAGLGIAPDTSDLIDIEQGE